MKNKRLLKVILALGLLACLCIHSGSGERDFEEFDDESEFDFDVPQDFDDIDAEVDEEVEDFPSEELDEEDEMMVEDEYFDGEEFEDLPANSRQSHDDITIKESTGKMKPFYLAYIVELCVVVCLGLYLLNYLIGRTRNSSIASSWLQNHRDVLDNNFALVGDNGEGDEPTEGEIVKLADDEFVIWCSGRVNCSGMLVHIKLSPRQDLFSTFSGIVTQNNDSMTIIFQLDEMDSFVFAVGQKRAIQKLVKEYEDLHRYTPTIKPIKGSTDLFQAAESGEVSSSVLNDRVMAFISENSGSIISIHITDQYTGPIQESDDSESVVVVKKPEKRIQLTFSGIDNTGSSIKFGLQLCDHIRNVKLSKEGKAKAIRNRTKVSANLEKMAHAQRQEAAQQRKEDKAKAAKEKMLAETDPEKQRKMEEKENKKARKKTQQRMKSMRVAMK